MSDQINDGKRDFLRSAAILGVASGVLATASTPREAMAQMLETGIREDSSLSKVRKEGVMRVGYSQTGPWFYKDAKTGDLGGIYKDAVDRLAKEMEVKVDYKVTRQRCCAAPRRLRPVRIVADISGAARPRGGFCRPLLFQGSLLLCHKDNADRFKTAADANKPDVTFSVTSGASEEPRIPLLFP
jgi:ABC-type amino acid transport substrate-binding protein